MSPSMQWSFLGDPRNMFSPFVNKRQDLLSLASWAPPYLQEQISIALYFSLQEFSEQKVKLLSVHPSGIQFLVFSLPLSLSLLMSPPPNPMPGRQIPGREGSLSCLGTQLQLAVAKLTFTAMKLCYRHFIEITQSNRVKPFLYGNHFPPSNFIGKNSLIEPPS